MILILKLSDIYHSIMVLLSSFQKFIIAQGGNVVLKLSHIYDSDFKTIIYLSFHHGFIKLVPKVHYCTGRWCSVLETYNTWQNGQECAHCCL